MRPPTLESDHWRLLSAEEANFRNPDSFHIPPLDQRQALKRGQAAKLMFEVEAEDETGHPVLFVERMWVLVTERVGGHYLGVLGNQPLSVEPGDGFYLIVGAEVPFRAEHVIDIESPPEGYVEGQLAVPPARRWPRT